MWRTAWRTRAVWPDSSSTARTRPLTKAPASGPPPSVCRRSLACAEDGAEYADLQGAPAGLDVEVQRVAHPSRVHLDIESDDIDAEADRLEKLGARRIGFVKRWWVMEAPTGHRFCIVRMRERDTPANHWP
ncbi:MAG: VOC family protein [Stenotrophomonas maltophilia]